MESGYGRTPIRVRPRLVDDGCGGCVMSTGVQPLSHRVRWRHHRVLWLVAALFAAIGVTIGVDRIFFATQTRAEFMQHTLDGLVTGPNKLAPGATAYVS